MHDCAGVISWDGGHVRRGLGGVRSAEPEGVSHFSGKVPEGVGRTPAEEASLAVEWEVHLAAAVGGTDVYVAVIGEADLHLRVFPELVYRQEGLGEGWYAAYVADQNMLSEAAIIDHPDGEVADAVHRAVCTVGGGHDLGGWADVA